MRINPFRPGNTADPEFFVGRVKEIETYLESLNQSKFGNPQHIAIMGERGIGKTSLLRKFESITNRNEHLVVRRDLDSSLLSITDLVNFILTIIKAEGIVNVKDKISDFFKKFSWSVSVGGLGVDFDAKRPVALQEILYNELKKVSDNTKDEYASICIMLDEAEHLEMIEGSWSFLRTVFSRLNENGANYLLIVAGKLGLFEKIKEIFSPMERFFYPWEIGPLSKSEVEEMMSKPFFEVDGTVSKDVLEKIYTLSAGSPFVIQVIGFHLYESGENQIDMMKFNEKWPEIIDRLEVQLFKSRYGVASPREREVLRKMADSPSSNHNAQDLSIKMTMTNKHISTNFGSLVKKNCLMKTSLGNFKLFHPLFGEYIKKRYSAK